MLDKDKDELLTIMDSLVTADASGAIERQEARGQSAFVASAVLPKKCQNATREQLESLGIVFGADVDDLFVEVQLPEGWKKVATDHSMWSELLDAKGRKRAGIFYKAAFYDRSAHMSLNRRYVAHTQPINGYGGDYKQNDPHIGVMLDSGAIVWKTDRQAVYGANTDWETLGEIERETKEYIDTHYPNHADPLAYWD